MLCHIHVHELSKTGFHLITAPEKHQYHGLMLAISPALSKPWSVACSVSMQNLSQKYPTKCFHFLNNDGKIFGLSEFEVSKRGKLRSIESGFLSTN